MQCSRCQGENPAGQKFCGECGARLAAICAACGASNPPAQKFCGECGHALTPDLSAAGTRAPETYTPKHLAEKILSSRGALEGERKQVTILFADLKGSMELLADRDPEEARRLLDPVLERMMDAVHRYEGTVNQVMGDGIMALFGAPLAHEDHAVRACYAALRMQESVQRHADEVRRSAGVSVAIRVGINSGEVVVRSIGSDLRMDYTAVGQTTHLAARMEQTALPGSVLVTGGTLALAEGYVVVKPLGPVPVKGLADPVDVFELTGVGAARTRLQARVSRGLSRFVGRDAEMAAVIQALERARAGHGQVVGLVGEPGVGKSRLVWEVTHSHRVHEWLVLAASSVSYGKATPYLPVIDLLKAYFHVEARDDARRVRERVTGKLLTLDRSLEPGLPALLALLDVGAGDEAWAALDPSQRRHHTLDAIKRLLLRESQLQPVLVVFEDLHWIDSETQLVLDGLVDGLAGAHVLFLFNFRPEYEHRWPPRTSVTQLRLDPLRTENAREFLDALLGDDAALDALKAMLVERTNGNPFFLEESVRGLIEAGIIVGEPGRHRLARAPEAVQVPATVQAVLAARIDRLAPDDKRLLQTASVIGKDVPFGLLAAIADLADDALRAALGRLEAAEFLYEVTLFPELEYTFKHALTTEVAYGSLLQDRRRILHGAIVAALERMHAERLAEHTERLAHHAFRGEVWDKAAVYALQAGRRAMDRSATSEGRAYAEQGLAAAERLAPGRTQLEMTLDLGHQVAASALFALGTSDLATHERMLDTAEQLGDEPRLVRAKIVLANTLWFLGRSQRAQTIVEEALARAEAIEDPSLQVLAGLDLGQVRRSTGQYREAVEVLDRVAGKLDGPLAKDRMGRTLFPSVMVRVALGNGLAERGALGRASAGAAEAPRVAEALRHPASLANAYATVGLVLLVQGRFDEARPPLERGVAIVREHGMIAFEALIAGRLAVAHAGAGRVADALPLVQAAAERAPLHPVNHGPVLALVAETYVLAGSGDDAHAAAHRSVTICRELGLRGAEARGLKLLADAVCLHDRADLGAAESAYREALEIASSLEMRPLIAQCQFGLGKLARRTGRHAEASERLAIAESLYGEMDMQFWRDQANWALHE